MRKRIFIPAILVIAAVAALVWWQTSQREVPPAPEVKPPAIEEPVVSAPPPPKPPESTPPEEIPEAVAEVFEEVSVPEEAPAPPEPPADPSEPWTQETLAGTTWDTGDFEMSFREDGMFMVGDNEKPRSRWMVEGNRVKLYDDKGEVHYLEIEGGDLTFNDKPVGQVK